ncbi:MAG: type-F conjugative transfer system protein TraW [Planctomycetota bacterium]
MRRALHGRTALVAAAVLLSFAAGAQDLGVIGPVYPITEPSLLEVILSKLREAEVTGVLARLQRDTQANVKRGIEQPAPVAKITKTIKARSFYYDPSIVVPYAITDAEGKVIVAPGTKMNPLDTVSLSKTLLFIDARDAAQVGRARSILDERGGKVKVILTGGSYLDLMRRWKRPVFYDQQGQLTDKLGIRHVPALVSQEGKRLRIDEIL